MKHLFGECEIAARTWASVSQWVEMQVPSHLRISILLSWPKSLIITKLRRELLQVIVQTTLLVLWKYRNNVLFRNNGKGKEMIFNMVVDYSFLCFSSRNRNAFMSWSEWLNNPLISL